MTTYLEITQVKSSIGRKPDHRGTLRALGWQPATPFDAGLERTVSWYRGNPGWWRTIKSG